MSRVGTAAAWLVAVLAIALGGAGLVSAMDPGAARTAIAEMTFRGDAEVAPLLDRATAGFQQLSDDVDALGGQARGALAAMIARQPDTVDGAIAAGAALLEDIDAQSRTIAATLASVPYVGTSAVALHLSPPTQDRYARLAAALHGADGLKDAWDRLTTGASAAGQLMAQLTDHDTLVGQAATLGRGAKYAAAIAILKQAEATIAASRVARNKLAATVDVGVLDQWLDRNEAYDKALSNLYDALASVGGKVTDAVRAAVAAEQAARAQLPPDARGLVLIMAEIGQGGLNDAVVIIEQAKAALASALEPAPEPS